MDIIREFKKWGHTQVLTHNLNISSNALDLINQLLFTKKSGRITVNKALSHSFIAGKANMFAMSFAKQMAT